MQKMTFKNRKQMKLLFSFIIAVLLLTNCGENKDATTTKDLASSSAVKSEERAPVSTASGNDIVGTWKLHLDAFDQNENQELEDEERKKGVSNNNMLQFNADGTCRIQNIFNGTYTIKEEGGKKILTVQRKKVEGEETEDPPPDKYHIKSVTKDELILLVVDGAGANTFWIFKRIK